MTKITNIVVAGGSGNWCEKNHLPAILKLKEQGFSVRILAICDHLNPYEKLKNNKVLKQILKKDKPIWINSNRKNKRDILQDLNELHSKHGIDILIISTNPSVHYFYSMWAVNRAIHVSCDKPPIVFANAAYDFNQAKAISTAYDRLLQGIKLRNKESTYYFNLPLRRRAMTAFLYIANSISEIYDKTSQPITHMNIIVNNGILRYPQEFLHEGAHGYLDGVGSLCHSNYHYIDIVAWYISLMKELVKYVRITPQYVYRVRDYIELEGYRTAQEFIEDKSNNINNKVKLPESVLNSELDAIFNIELINKKQQTVGVINYQTNHTSYTPRTVQYDPSILDPANVQGRMSHIYFDIHQGVFQNIQLFKNDVVCEKYSINTIRRQHPSIGIPYEIKVFNNPYEKNTVTAQDLLIAFIKQSAGVSVNKNHLKHLATLESQRLSIELFAAFYKAVSKHFSGETKSVIVRV
jgi:hypothetical protein